MFCNSFSLLFFSSRDLRGPWADLREILPHGRKPLQMLVQKFGGLPPNNFERENTLILARFRTPSHFELEYLRNEQRYSKKEKQIIASVFSRVIDGISPVNFGPLSTAFSRLMFTHEIDFFGRPYFGP